MSKDNLGDRMKEYEKVSRNSLQRKMPVIMRLDGKAFHTFTRGLNKPFDSDLNLAMADTAKYLCEQIQGAVIGYTQSDEISILLQDYENEKTDCWFGYDVQKMTSVSASMATAFFNSRFQHPTNRNFAIFDSRVFNIPFIEIENYFIFRNNDANRNSLNTFAQSVFSHKQLHGKSQVEVKHMLLEIGLDIDTLELRYRNGWVVCKCDERIVNDAGEVQKSFFIREQSPFFLHNREYLTKLVEGYDRINF